MRARGFRRCPRVDAGRGHLRSAAGRCPRRHAHPAPSANLDPHPLRHRHAAAHAHAHPSPHGGRRRNSPGHRLSLARWRIRGQPNPAAADRLARGTCPLQPGRIAGAPAQSRPTGRPPRANRRARRRRRHHRGRLRTAGPVPRSPPHSSTGSIPVCAALCRAERIQPRTATGRRPAKRTRILPRDRRWRPRRRISDLRAPG